ncbi:hypothetical protein [Halorarum salinum]|uniref:Uncharacterized protein n=1 Tax=Halorarum salinum TaxID=2743089 RepID=A0A7D5L9U2_9EURY|nr:hypothetical protein [Halobaculum salinum]QLG61351.1 hypothetical protein HUG12_06225 [Halobaculum salinum]
MVSTRYPALAGLLAGVATLRDRLVPFVYAWTDADATTLAAYYSVTTWLAFLLVPVAAVTVGYAGGRTAADADLDLGRVGLVCLAAGLAASVVAIAVSVLLRPDSVMATTGLPLRAVGYAHAVVRAPAIAAVATVAGVALAADRAAA